MSVGIRPAARREARVVASHGRDATVQDDTGQRIHCRLHGRRLAVVCGDRVRWVPGRTESGAGVIIKVLPRRTVLARLALRGSAEAIAANLTRLMAVVAPSPPPDFGLCDRYLAAAIWGGLDACIVANKCEPEFPPAMTAALEDYLRIGYRVVRASRETADGMTVLREKLARH